MRVLLLHPEDDPAAASWARGPWDRVVDMGAASEQARSRWSKILGCRVEALPPFDTRAAAAMRKALSSGLGHVVDQYGLDWWELIAIRFCEQFETLSRLRELATSISAHDELFATRACTQVSLFNAMGFSKVRCLGVEPSYCRSVWRRIANAADSQPSHLLRFLADKYDSTYRLRRFIPHPSTHSAESIVLLPVAHLNATRTAVAYASMLPEQRFLLVATRQSGWMANPPANVTARKLAAYAPGKCNTEEHQQLFERWRYLEPVLKDCADTSVLCRLGTFAGASKLLKDGLTIRDSWLRVFNESQVSAVFCTDTSNPNTHMPLLLARHHSLPAIACHHGALDGYYLVKRNHADIVLAKGEMERDYLQNTCGIPKEKIEVGGHRLPYRKNTTCPKDVVVFFSEPYALGSGRCGDIYRELLPPLAEIARRMHLQVVLKLHPMESKRERSKLAEAALGQREHRKLQIIEGPLTDDLLDRTRFALTLQSTAAVDCAISGIPVFLCCWLGYSHYFYVEQFVKFRAGLPLYAAGEISEIPVKLGSFSPARRAELWDSISQAKLRSLLQPLKMAAAV